MKCKWRTEKFVLYVICVLSACTSLSCDETLPEYHVPQNVLSVTVTNIEEMNSRSVEAGRQAVRIVLAAENIHDEVFQDSANVQGTVRVWWKRKPTRYSTINLTEKNFSDRTLIHNGKLMILPGQRILLNAQWDLTTDDGLYMVSEMDFTRARQRHCQPDAICSNPEEFEVEVSLSLYDRIGYLTATPVSFTFIGKIY